MKRIFSAILVVVGGCAAMAPLVQVKGGASSGTSSSSGAGASGGSTDGSASPGGSSPGGGAESNAPPTPALDGERNDITEGPDWISVKQKRHLIGLTVAAAKAELLRDGETAEINVVVLDQFDAKCAEDHVCGVDEPDGASFSSQPFNLYVNRHVQLAAPPP